MSSKYVQEQNNSSKNEVANVPPSSSLLSQEGGYDSAWGKENYPKDCEWYGYDRAVDGDTIIVSPPPAPPSRGRGKQIRVRMIGINTPESKKEGTAIEPYALEAGAALKNLLKNEKEVCLIEDEVGDKYDTYGRKLSYVFTDDGLDANAEMIRLGLAEAYTRFSMERTREFESLERAARKEGVGQWD